MAGLLDDDLIEEFERDGRPGDDTDLYAEWATGLSPDCAEAMWAAGFDHHSVASWFQAVRELWEGSSSEPWNPEVLAAMAQVWALAEFGPEGVLDWAFVADVVGPKDAALEARRWRAAGFTPREAARWLTPEPVFDFQSLEDARKYAAHGWDVASVTFLTLFLKRLDGFDAATELEAWMETGIALSDVLDFVRAGVPVDSGKVLHDFRDREALQRELKLREADLPPFDEFDAIRINDALFICFGDEPGHRLWDQPVTDPRTMRSIRSQFGAEFGTPNSGGHYLARIVEFSDDADEDGWTYAAMFSEGVARNLMTRLGLGAEKATLISDRNQLNFSIRVCGQIDLVIACTPESGLKAWSRRDREPTTEERQRWAAR